MSRYAEHTVDPPMLIRMCLNCKKEKCNNCIRDFPKEKLATFRERKKE